MICDTCNKELKNRHYYLCICGDCINPGTTEAVIKKQLDRIQELGRYITEQRADILDLTEENNKYLKIIKKQKNELLQRKK